ncbi:MAG: hypothetical protein A2W90_20350 [Bacteroidetes bacterium GWF2_42_66]|nr:MAG: hypothetical protein A2W92_06215 [Bacteroidetes bacterium GWA2_42_15]OFX98464.1 MAG: hypothetical protein A2W89_08715 [Bacteroidetes bacterium GWE2_42_39]OFY42849.1 MAG: hypothetical protein A2W90_20350 [Bacteroidetes bacterium GWF2_42_66]HBL74477.1 hypothetical protein [Prolixibacteraceae bacterium]HCR89015.1 hypothetical protein [Prolixibacteraceae bacterium]
MNKFYLFLMALLLTAMNSFSQEKPEEFKPYGKPFMKIYSNYHSTFSDGETEKAFELTRVYLGYEYFFSKNFSGKVNFDVGDPETGKHQMAAFVKNAELEYNTNNFTVHFGLITTTQFKVQEDFWGYRYLLKSFQDEYKLAPSADLGVCVSYRVADWVNADFAVYNGEGYKKLESDNIFKNTVGITLLPAEGFTVRGLYDWMGDNVYQQSWIGFAGYSAKRFSIAAEYNYQKNQNMTEGHDWYGPSFYATCFASKKIKLFARFDELSSKKPEGATNGWNLANDGQLFIFGMEYAPVRGVNLAPNFQGWNPADNNMPYRSTVFLSCEIKF